MRLNKYIAQASGLSRRNSDQAILEGRVLVNGKNPSAGQMIISSDKVLLDGKSIEPDTKTQTIMLNKPVGYVCSREGQGSRTIYDLLPASLHQLKSVGRLDKDSSGLILLTNDGQLANTLTHPRYQKTKSYHVRLDRPLTPKAVAQIKKGVVLHDGISKIEIKSLDNKKPENSSYEVKISEGRNRQIRRTFATLGYEVVKLHRTRISNYHLDDLGVGEYKTS